MFSEDTDRKNNLTDEAVVAEVARHQDGVGARQIARTIVENEQGQDERAVQLAIQRSIDTGRLSLGSKLELRVAEKTRH